MPAKLPPNRLRQLRERKGLKIYDISARVRRDPSTVYGWERGEVAVPDDVKLTLAKLYAVTPAFLMGWPEKAPEKAAA